MTVGAELQHGQGNADSATEGTEPPHGHRNADLAVYKAVRAHELMLNQATAAFEHAVLAPLFLLNGGGAVAFLALTGAASGEESSLSINTWVAGLAVGLWVAGLVAAAVATWWGYRVQQAFSVAGRWRRQRIELEFLDLSWGIRQLVINKPLQAVLAGDWQPKRAQGGKKSEAVEWVDAARGRLDSEALKKQEWWGKPQVGEDSPKQPWWKTKRAKFGILIGVSVTCFVLGSGLAALAIGLG